MKTAGAVIAIIGVLVLLAGAGMDTTTTTRTCYEADYDGVAYDSEGCVETTYNNPAPQTFAIISGFSMIIGGGILFSRSKNSGSSGKNQTTRSQRTDPTTDPVTTDQIGSFGDSDEENEDSTTNKTTSDSFVKKLQEHQKRKESK